MGSEMGITADTKPVANLDGVGIFWITFATVCTVALASAMAFLFIKRSTPILRIRGLPLSFGAVFWLHMYWIAVETGYVYGPLMPVVVEFWIMGLWLPFGIALFHASNSRFLYVANAQKKYARRTTEPYRIFTRRPGRISLRESAKLWWKQLDYTNKVLSLVATGMTLHVSTDALH